MLLRLAIAGASGRMGRMLLDAAAADASVDVVAALEHSASPMLGQTISGLTIQSDLDAALANCDVLIDFTRPEGSLTHLQACSKHRVAAVIGTTGFSADQLDEIDRVTETTAVVLSPNMSLGVNLTAKLVAMASRSLGMDADVEVFEAHHKLKVDAPSGTALMLGRVVAEARGQVFDEVAVYDRHGNTGERQAGTIGFSVLRAGDIVGDHTVFLALNGERIEISHKSSSRATYAQGAIRAAKFLVGKKSGLYSMADVLGLS
jgi:4-hydroxy-tetrahydrodipicolinate reductase